MKVKVWVFGGYSAMTALVINLALYFVGKGFGAGYIIYKAPRLREPLFPAEIAIFTLVPTLAATALMAALVHSTVKHPLRIFFGTMGFALALSLYFPFLAPEDLASKVALSCMHFGVVVPLAAFFRKFKA